MDLTGDHPVLTERGYVPVSELRPGDRVATGQGLSALARDVVCGTLLGDGSLNAKSAYVSFGHSQRQADYAAFKAELLAEFSPRSAEFAVAGVVGGASSTTWFRSGRWPTARSASCGANSTPTESASRSGSSTR